MLVKTEHDLAPWHVIPADSKRYARIAVIETVLAEAERGSRARQQPPPR